MFKGIIAISNNRVIGNHNDLPWPRAKSDLKFFKDMTWGCNVIFGRRTFEGLGRMWLPKRQIYVLTTNNTFGWTKSEFTGKEGISCTHIVRHPEDLPNADYWVAGGKAIYQLFLSQMSELYITYINGTYEGDVMIAESELEDYFNNVEIVKTTF